MPKKVYTLRDKLLTLAQAYTQAEISEKIGVSTRTFRRWKNEGVLPSEHLPAIAQALAELQSEFEKEHKRVAANVRRDRRAHPQAAQVPKELRVIPVGHRRELNVYRKGKATGEVKDSDWVNYDVRAWNFEEILGLLRGFRDQGRLVQLIVRIPKGSRYWRDERGRPGRVVKETTRSGTAPTFLGNMDDGDLYEWLSEYTPLTRAPSSRQVLFVSALDKGGRPVSKVARPKGAPRAKRRR